MSPVVRTRKYPGHGLLSLEAFSQVTGMPMRYLLKIQRGNSLHAQWIVIDLEILPTTMRKITMTTRDKGKKPD
jgi:hypothetical protein